MNTVATVQAWLTLAPQLLALIVALESMFPHRTQPTGPVKLAAFQQITNAAVAQTVPEPDHATLTQLNTAFAAEASQAPATTKAVQEIA